MNQKSCKTPAEKIKKHKNYKKMHKSIKNASKINQKTIRKAPGGLGGLKLDEIEAANPFLTLPTAKSGLRWPVMSLNFPQDSHRFP